MSSIISWVELNVNVHLFLSIHNNNWQILILISNRYLTLAPLNKKLVHGCHNSCNVRSAEIV